MLKGVEYGLELLKKRVVWCVGNGESVRTRRDPWIPKGPSLRPITPKGNCGLYHVSDFLDEHGAWKSQLLAYYFWPIDVEEIWKIRTSPRQREDFIAMQPEQTGVFIV